MDLEEYAGDQVTIIFGKNDRIESGAASIDKPNFIFPIDSAHNTNIIPLKGTPALVDVEPLQITIRTVTDDAANPTLDHEIRFKSLPPIVPHPTTPQTPQTVQLAAANDSTPVSDASTEEKEKKPEPPKRQQTCLVVRYEYPDEEAAKKAAAAKANWQQAQHNRAEQALRKQQIGTDINLEYDFQGDRDIGPHGDPNGATITDRADIYDDGITTVLHFSGSAIPAFYTINADDSDGAVIETTIEDHGVVKLHGVFDRFRMRMDTTKVLCIINRHLVDHNPNTGTVSPKIERDLKTKGQPVS